MSDNPFAEPEDDNRTVIRPTPGRRRTPAAEQPTVARSEQPPPEARLPQRPAVAAEGTEDIAIGGDVLAAAAAPLLQLMARLRNTASPPDSGDLRSAPFARSGFSSRRRATRACPWNSFARLTTRCAPASTTSC